MVRTSTSHPSASAWYNATTFMGTLAATDPSGVTGYAVKLDQSPTTAAGTTVTQTTADVNWSARTDGTWWVHAAAKDKAGLWSPTQHNGFNVDTTGQGAGADFKECAGLVGVLSTSTQDPDPLLRDAGPMTTPPPPGLPPWPIHHPRYAGADNSLLPQQRRWLHLAADIALAIGLLVVDVITPFITFLFGLDAAGYTMFDAAADNSSVSLTRPFTYVAVVGGIVLISAFLLFLARAFVSSGVQVLAGLVLVLVAVVGMNDADRKAHPQPAPTSPSINPGALCRSGGDNSECGGS
ncbi:DUF6234 family protein [Streptomyces peucetius]|nr:hypothetical protein CGZ69_01680 [Streptomyces peucetius subsp. caesius ATCC 27952]